MPFVSKIRSLCRNLFSVKRVEQDLQDELLAHLELLVEDKIRSGMTREEAERASRLEIGGTEQVKEQVREIRIGSWLHSVFGDARYGMRQVRKNPGFSAVAIITIALAIGANAVVFCVLNALILRPLNVPNPESLYAIQRLSDHSQGQSYPGYIDLRDRNRSFEHLAAFNILQAGLNSGANASIVWVMAASGNYFDTLGIRPYLGRFFRASDERGPNSAPYVVISHAYWHSHFQEDRKVIGRTILLNKHPFTILGVAPPDFRGTLMFFTCDFWIPAINQEQIEGTSILNTRGTRWIFQTFGHLKQGVTPEQAAADLNSIGSDLEKAYPKDHSAMKFSLARPSLYGDVFGRPVKAFVAALMLLAALILLAACANLGSLFAARASDREREIAMRLALGASRLRVLRQLFTESILISLLGGAIGIWGSVTLLRALRVWQPFPQFPFYLPLTPDLSVYAVTFVLTILSGVLFGAAAVRQVMVTDPYEIVKSGARWTAQQRLAARDVLVVLQIAICAVLVMSSMVALRGLIRSLHSDFGFRPANALLVNPGLHLANYQGEAAEAMQKRMLAALDTVPELKALGLVDWAPLTNGTGSLRMVFRDETNNFNQSNAVSTPFVLRISTGYLEAAGTTLLMGRAFTHHDDSDAPRVAIVNRRFAEKIFDSPGNALGRYFKLKDGSRIQIVGIVEQGKYASLTETAKPAMFLPILQWPWNRAWIVVRSDSEPQQFASVIKRKLLALDPGLPVYIQTWSQGLSLPLFPARIATASLGILGLMGAMLSITGIFGMAAYSVSKRMRELGIRMALGAQRKEVLQAALGHAVKVLAYGSATGLLLGIFATRVLAAIVYQATPRDPLVLSGVVLAMSCLGLLATWIPAQRALSVEPLILLREE